MENKRIEWVDIYKGIGIILMIMGHIWFGNHFDKYIHAFHMPMFFFISGFLYKRPENFKIYFIKKLKSLIVPYISFGFFHYIIWLLIHFNKEDWRVPLIHLFWNNSDLLPICGALWFLTSLFFTDILFYVIEKYFRIESFIIIFFLGIIGCFEIKLFSFRLPYSIGISFVGLVFYYLGFLFNKYKETKVIRFLINLDWWVTVIIFVLTFICIFMNRNVNMREGKYDYIPLFWLNAIFSIIVILNFSRYMNNNGLLIIKEICNLIKYIGKNSIIFMCLNQFFILLLKSLFSKFFIISIFVRILILLLTMSCLFFMSYVINKSFLKIFIGKSMDYKRKIE